jgi:hypothetical protein
MAGMYVETAIKQRANVAKTPVDTAALDRDRAYIHDDIVALGHSLLLCYAQRSGAPSSQYYKLIAKDREIKSVVQSVHSFVQSCRSRNQERVLITGYFPLN